MMEARGKLTALDGKEQSDGGTGAARCEQVRREREKREEQVSCSCESSRSTLRACSSASGAREQVGSSEFLYRLYDCRNGRSDEQEGAKEDEAQRGNGHLTRLGEQRGGSNGAGRRAARQADGHVVRDAQQTEERVLEHGEHDARDDDQNDDDGL